MKRRDEFLVFGVTLLVYALTYWDRSPYDAHVRQAVAFLHGHAYIDAPHFIEHAQIGAYSYQLHPPLPAILLMPFAAFWGMSTNQNWFALVVGALDVTLAYRLLGKIRCPRIWLTVFFGLGTIMWYESVNGASWEVSMLVAVMMTLLALNEVFGKQRGWIVGLWAGLAALARYDLALVWPVYTLMIPPREWLRLAPGFALGIVGYVGFNFVRYHSPFDLGVGSYLYTTPEAGKNLFAIRYLPNNLYTLIFMAPGLDDTFPYFHPKFGGQSILTTSPGFLLALRASWRRADVRLIAFATVLSAAPVLFYVGNGSSQFGTRHFVAVFPFLLVLMAMGNPKLDQMGKTLIVASVCLIALGIYSIRMGGL